MVALATFNTALSTFYCPTPLLPPLYSTAVMGRGLREVAADVVCTLGMEEDEGKIDALAVSLAEAANKTFGSDSDLKTKLLSSLNQSSLSLVLRFGRLAGVHDRVDLRDEVVLVVSTLLTRFCIRWFLFFI